ncbi:MAG: 2-phospho-L-lactate guanylyltransferase [Anaerolineae bacterium]|nr:2-phospho-L-lactate guanylyltransferase [Anaerolineae bacterium]
MTLWAIVPVKPLRRGKSRLASVLSEDERTELNRQLLANTLDTLTQLSEIEQVLVISRDPEALALAREHGARTVREAGAPKLNAALTRATVMAGTQAARGVLVLPADLPQITVEDVRTMLAAGQEPPVVVIAPDHRGKGTNALFINPAGMIKYDFGPDSFKQHCKRAKKAGATLKVCELSSLARDVDLPEDLAFLDTEAGGFAANGKG